MYIKLKILFLYCCKYIGLFSILRMINKNKLRILCYHGVSKLDEHKFIPGNFIQHETFKKRIEFLEGHNYNFLSLEEASKRQQNNEHLDESIVLTFDDGFQTINDETFPYLKEKKLPVTLYVTTYYAQKPFPIFRISIQYLMWKSDELDFEVRGFKVNTKNYTSVWKLILDAESNCSASEQNDILEEVQEVINLKLTADVIRSFSILTIDEITELGNDFDIQLHTHRHIFPNDHKNATKEINDNSEILSKINKVNLHHFCYPSGVWNKNQFPVLEQTGIKTATTCELSLATHKDHPFALPRIIDSEKMTLIQFEAELVGMGDLLRLFKK